MLITSPEEKIIAAVSEKKDGNMRGFGNIYSQENRYRFLLDIDIDPDDVVSCAIEHLGRVVKVEGNFPRVISADGLITATAGIYLSVTAADCPALFLWDPVGSVIGIAHCGWKPLRARIVENIIEKMAAEGSQPKNIIAYIGPAIGPCHYHVKEDVIRFFKKYEAVMEVPKAKKKSLWLGKVIFAKLCDLGLEPYNVNMEHECTYCSLDENNLKEHKYFSLRRQNPSKHWKIPLEAMLAVIGIKK